MKISIDELITFCEEKEYNHRVSCKRYDDASGYTRSKDKSIRTASAEIEETNADFYREIAETLHKYQELRKEEIPEHTDGIKVGDEVTVEGVNGIVVREPYSVGPDNELFVLVWYGQSMSSNSLKNVVPTGRHFPQITEVLEQLK